MRICVILWEILGNFWFGILGQLGPLIRKVSDRRNTGRSRRAVGSLSAILGSEGTQPQRRRNRACGRTVPRESGLGPTCLTNPQSAPLTKLRMGTAWPTCSRILRLWPSTTIRTVTVSCSWCWNAGSLGARAGARRTRETGASAAHARRAPEAAAEARRGAIREDLIGAPPVMSAFGGKADVSGHGAADQILSYGSPSFFGCSFRSSSSVGCRGSSFSGSLGTRPGTKRSSIRPSKLSTSTWSS